MKTCLPLFATLCATTLLAQDTKTGLPVGDPAESSAKTAETPAAAPAPAREATPLSPQTLQKIAAMTPLFDGQSLDGWIQAPPYPLNLSGEDVVDVAALAKRLRDQTDGVSRFLMEMMDDAAKGALSTASDEADSTKALKSALTKNLNRLIAGSALYDAARFQGVELREETNRLLKENPEGQRLARLNRMLLEDAYAKEIAKSPSTTWVVKDGAMASVGAGRGVIYSKDDYDNFRLIFTMRHVSGKPDHQACVLIYCTRPPSVDAKGLDALGGIQFQPPNGGSWDYRPGKNNGGKGLFTRLTRPQFNPHEWSQVELLVRADGSARMAVAQPVGTKAVEVLTFQDPTAGKKGPIAWQMHNAGLFDEYKDVRVEVNPSETNLLTTEE